MANTTFTDLLGSMLGTNVSPTSTDRLKDALGAGGQPTGADLTKLLKSLGIDASDISGRLGGLFGGKGGAGIGQTLSGTLEEAQKAIGANKQLALVALGSLVGAILDGDSKLQGAVGGGALAALAAMAYQALKGTPQESQEVPSTLIEPASPTEQEQLENHAQLMLRAMINATKADGQIDQDEVRRILGKLQESGADKAALDFVMAEMNKPMETEAIVAMAKGNPQLAAELYAASLLAISVDTPAERTYMQNLSTGLGLAPQAVTNLEKAMGLV
jgi:uncharacterized membrane protein YebE (DUF533 family)